MQFNKKAEQHLSVHNKKLLEASNAKETIPKFSTEHVRPMESQSHHTTIKDSHAGLFSLDVNRIIEIVQDSHSIQTNFQKRHYNNREAMRYNA